MILCATPEGAQWYVDNHVGEYEIKTKLIENYCFWIPELKD